ncbi:hypothetical protein CU098_009488, partial [Rhizopus stolonifer]
YNPAKRKRTKSNRRKRKKMLNRRNPGIPHLPVDITWPLNKNNFTEMDGEKMPLIIFGNGMKGKSHVRFRGKRVGVSEIIYRHLKRREKLGELSVLDIDEFRTSSVCDTCHQMNVCNHRDQDISFHTSNMAYISAQIWSGSG